MLGNELITGDTCYLTATTPDDADQFGNILDSHAMWQLHPHWQFQQMTASDWYDKQVKSLDYRFAIRSNAGDLQGISGLADINWQSRFVHLRLMMTSADWDKQIAIETVKLMTQYVFMDINLNRLYCFVPDYHHLLRDVLESAGWTNEGCLRDTLFFDDSFHDTLLYGILQSD